MLGDVMYAMAQLVSTWSGTGIHLSHHTHGDAHAPPYTCPSRGAIGEAILLPPGHPWHLQGESGVNSLQVSTQPCLWVCLHV